jgi:hypothetical protein
MAKSTAKRLVKAQSRLRRIEEAIAPYTEAAVPQTAPPRGEWIPGDFAHIRKDEAEQPRLRIPEIN